LTVLFNGYFFENARPTAASTAIIVYYSILFFSLSPLEYARCTYLFRRHSAMITTTATITTTFSFFYDYYNFVASTSTQVKSA